MSEPSALAPENPYYPYVLFYIPSLNRFMDHQWVIVHDLNELFNTWQLSVWKAKRQDAILTTKDGTEMMVYYLNDEEEEEVFDYLSFNDSFGVKGDRACY